MIKQEIWIQLESSVEFEEFQSYILTLEAELLGEVDVVLYARKERTSKRLSRIYTLSMKSVPVLMEKLGEQRVKVIARDNLDEAYKMGKLDVNREIEYRKLLALEQMSERISFLSDVLSLVDDKLDKVITKDGLVICGSVNTYNMMD